MSCNANDNVLALIHELMVTSDAHSTTRRRPYRWVPATASSAVCASCLDAKSTNAKPLRSRTLAVSNPGRHRVHVRRGSSGDCMRLAEYAHGVPVVCPVQGETSCSFKSSAGQTRTEKASVQGGAETNVCHLPPQQLYNFHSIRDCQTIPVGAETDVCYLPPRKKFTGFIRF